jgi:hypothetical protein
VEQKESMELITATQGIAHPSRDIYLRLSAATCASLAHSLRALVAEEPRREGTMAKPT